VVKFTVRSSPRLIRIDQTEAAASGSPDFHLIGQGRAEKLPAGGEALANQPYLGIREMSKRCDVCEKGPSTGRSYTFLRSHWNPHNKRRWLPNLQPVRVKLQNSVKKMKVCTSCLKAGKVQRAL
jgi:large subunit ribosomal protein L28